MSNVQSITAESVFPGCVIRIRAPASSVYVCVRNCAHIAEPEVGTWTLFGHKRMSANRSCACVRVYRFDERTGSWIRARFSPLTFSMQLSIGVCKLQLHGRGSSQAPGYRSTPTVHNFASGYESFGIEFKHFVIKLLLTSAITILFVYNVV